MEWPTYLIEDIARRRTVLVLGAGVSKNSIGADGKTRPPTWHEFLKSGVDRCPKPRRHIEALLRQGDYLTACELIQTRLDEDFKKLLDDVFVLPKFKTAGVHETLFKLDSRIVVTPNFEKIYDSYALKESQSTVVVKNYYDDDVSAVLRGDQGAAEARSSRVT